jgi:Cu+-exporting ATPase
MKQAVHVNRMMASSPNSPGVTTHSFLLSNLHCPSCVSHIHGFLSKLHPPPNSVSPSLVTSWVTVEHSSYLSVRDIREAFKNAGFDVVDVTPNDLLPSDGTAVRDRLKARFGSEKNGGIGTKCAPSKKHLENCQACRLQAGGKNADPMFGGLESKEALVVVDSAGSRDIWRASLAIGGMTCAVCSNGITNELTKRDVSARAQFSSSEPCGKEARLWCLQQTILS